MKKTLIPAVMLILAACNPNPAAAPVKPPTDSVVAKINSPYPVTYSSSFAMGDPKNAETVLTLWKDYDNGNISAHKDYFADSLEFYMADGRYLHVSKDSLLATIQKFRDNMQSVVDRVDAVTTLKSTDKNEDWVLIWGLETDTHKNGKVDSVNLMETWRLNKDGKANLVYQYSQASVPPKK